MKLIKTKIIATIILVVSLMTLALPFVTGADVVSASSDGNPRFVDEYGLLNSSQAKTLEKRLDEISDKHNFDVVVLVVDSINRKDPRVFAADYFEGIWARKGQHGDHPDDLDVAKGLCICYYRNEGLICVYGRRAGLS